MKPFLVAVTLSTLGLSACSEFTGADRYDQPPITVSGTEYEVFLLVRSVNPDYDDPRNDPEADTAYYAAVGPGSVVYCGAGPGRCAEAIRRFNNNEIPAETRQGM
jgi:hypothetical protein